MDLPIPPQSEETWAATTEEAQPQHVEPPAESTITNGSGDPAFEQAAPPAHINEQGKDEYPPPPSSSGDVKSDTATSAREKQIKPNKVYVGGLPEHTRHEDLQNCFGKLGNIVNIELKVGYGFVEFDTRESAEQSVEKYHDGYFMGNKIRVELSHGGGRTAKYTNEPGACFKCGSQGHWARECPNHGGGPPTKRFNDGPLPDREYHPRDARHDFPPPRDYRRLSPPRDYRDFPPPPPPRVRDYDDYRRGPPPPLDRYGPPPDLRARYGPPPPDFYRYGPPPPLPYDRYDRRPPPPDRLPPPGYLPPPPSGRPRSPPRFRDDYERPPPPRDYPDYRGRPPPMSPPGRYDYPPPPRAGPDAPRYR